MTLSDRTSKKFYRTVDISCSLGAVAYSDWTEQIKGYVSEPTISFKFSPHGPYFEEEFVEIELPLPAPNPETGEPHLLERLLDPDIILAVDVVVKETALEASNVAIHKSTLFLGEVLRITRNPEGTPNRVMLHCVNEKTMLGFAVGFLISDRCPWKVYGPACKAIVSGNKETGVVIQSFDPLSLQAVITGLLGPFGKQELYTRAELRSGGLSIGVRYWNKESPEVFYLQRQIPPSWIGQIITLRLGCQKTQNFCDTEHGNLERIGNLGVKTADYDPNFETGS